MIVNMPNKEGVTLATQGKYCKENIEVVPTFSGTLNEYLKGTKTDITAEDLAGVTEIRASAFQGSPITSVDIPNIITKIGMYAFTDCKSLTSVTIGGGVTVIGEYAFKSCLNLVSVDIPDSVTTIRREAFGRIGLKSVTIPDSVTSIGDYAFAESQLESVIVYCKGTGTGMFQACGKLMSVTFGKNVNGIGWRSFNGCKSLTSIVLPKSLTSIGDYGFENNTSLMEVVCLAETPPTLATTSFNGVPAECIYKVKPASVEAYKSATNWSVRADNIVALTDEEVARYGG